MRYSFLTLLSVFLLHVQANSQTFQWTKSYTGSGDYDITSVAVDPIGNVYTIGIFNSLFDADPGSGTTMLGTGTGGYDLFIIKTNSNGDFVWAKSIENNSEIRSNSIAVSSTGIYITGSFVGGVDFDPSPNTTFINSISDKSDMFILKLDTSGNLNWVKNMGVIGNFSSGESVAVDANDNIYTTGYFAGTIDFDPNAGTSNLSSNGVDDIFINKLNSSGDLLWAKNIGGLGTDLGTSITLDLFGNLLITGAFVDAVDFDPSAGITTLVSTIGESNCYILKLTQSGSFVWAKSFGGRSFGEDIKADPLGNISLTGNFSGTCDFNPGSPVMNLTSKGYDDIFISRLDSAGNYAWVKQIGGTDVENGTGIAIDQHGNSYITGTIYGTVKYLPGIDSLTVNTNGANDVLVVKITPEGKLIWLHSIGGVMNDKGNCIAISGTTSYYVGGKFSTTVDFDPEPTTYNMSASAFSDMFLFKWNQMPDGIENINQTSLEIYPNPSTNSISIQSHDAIRNATISIYSITGKLVYNQPCVHGKKLDIDISSLSAGMYLMDIIEDGQHGVYKFVKQ